MSHYLKLSIDLSIRRSVPYWCCLPYLFLVRERSDGLCLHYLLFHFLFHHIHFLYNLFLFQFESFEYLFFENNYMKLFLNLLFLLLVEYLILFQFFHQFEELNQAQHGNYKEKNCHRIFIPNNGSN